jgi:hypothetical protein
MRSGTALTNAEKQKRYREREWLKNNNEAIFSEAAQRLLDAIPDACRDGRLPGWVYSGNNPRLTLSNLCDYLNGREPWLGK